jgi:hypothetical protein
MTHSIEIKTDSHTTTEVTVLPPSFDWKLNTRSWLTSTLDNVKIKLGTGKELQPSRVLYIGPIKRLNDYYAPRA